MKELVRNTSENSTKHAVAKKREVTLKRVVSKWPATAP